MVTFLNNNQMPAISSQQSVLFLANTLFTVRILSESFSGQFSDRCRYAHDTHRHVICQQPSFSVFHAQSHSCPSSGCCPFCLPLAAVLSAFLGLLSFLPSLFFIHKLRLTPKNSVSFCFNLYKSSSSIPFFIIFDDLKIIVIILC